MSQKDLIQEIVEGREPLAVVGLGYVGLPLAVAFAKKVKTIGFDINAKKVEAYKRGHDVTREVGDEAVRDSKVLFTSDPAEIGKAAFVVVAVPTPVDMHNSPDLAPVESATRVVGQNLRRGAVVAYESTVYPGVTEDVCAPILERESGMKCGADFKIAYSPERINPGDRVHRLETIVKIVSGMDGESLDAAARIYGLVVEAGVYRASCIKVAEAAKVIENAQRDINIAFVNELSLIFERIGIDTLEVLQAAATKWNFLNFRPGLVGGHCIGVDPYYLTYKAEELGYHPDVLLAGRRINDDMARHVAESIVKLMIREDCAVKGANVLVLGLAFKENVPDIRNTKIIDMIKELEEFGVGVTVCDPVAEAGEVEREYGFRLADLDKLGRYDAVVLAVGHDAFKGMGIGDFKARLAPGRRILADVKGILDKDEAIKQGLIYWRL
jgi:UDP-N-acetyl-D-galactosamine dehydrogenase